MKSFLFVIVLLLPGLLFAQETPSADSARSKKSSPAKSVIFDFNLIGGGINYSGFTGLSGYCAINRFQFGTQPLVSASKLWFNAELYNRSGSYKPRQEWMFNSLLFGYRVVQKRYLWVSLLAGPAFLSHDRGKFSHHPAFEPDSHSGRISTHPTVQLNVDLVNGYAARWGVGLSAFYLKHGDQPIAGGSISFKIFSIKQKAKP